jgi:hypothetical protein
MRKWMIVLAIIVVAFTFGSINANAQTEITIGPISGNSDINFSGSGGVATMSFGDCSTVGPCNLVTAGSLVSGASTLEVGTGTFSTTATPITYALISSNGLNWTATGSVPLTYTFVSGTDSISGSVTFNQVISNGGALLLGTFFVNSVNAAGDLSAFFTAGNTYPIQFSAEYCQPSGTPCPASLDTIFNGTTATAVANISEGGFISTTPEPNSMLLFGTGLLAVGGILRRRLGLA